MGEDEQDDSLGDLVEVVEVSGGRRWFLHV